MSSSQQRNRAALDRIRRGEDPEPPSEHGAPSDACDAPQNCDDDESAIEDLDEGRAEAAARLRVLGAMIDLGIPIASVLDLMTMGSEE